MFPDLVPFLERLCAQPFGTPLTSPEPPPVARDMVDFGAAGGAAWDRGDRVVVLGSGQVDKEWEMQVFAMVGPRLPM